MKKLLSICLVLALLLVSIPVGAFTLPTKAESADSDFVYLAINYPNYLNNEAARAVVSGCLDCCNTVLQSYDGTDNRLLAFAEGFLNGTEILIKEIGSKLGVTQSTQEEWLQKNATEYLRLVSGCENILFEEWNSVEKKYSDFKFSLKGLDTADTAVIEYGKERFFKELSGHSSIFSEAEARKMADTLIKKQPNGISKFFDTVDYAIDLADLMLFSCQMLEVEVSTLKRLQNSISSDSELYKGINLVLEAIEDDPSGWCVKKYLSDQVCEIIIDEILKKTVNWAAEKASKKYLGTFGVTSAAVKTVASFLYNYAYQGAKIDEIYGATVAYNFYVTVSTAYLDKYNAILQQYNRGQEPTKEMLSDYVFFYEARRAALLHYAAACKTIDKYGYASLLESYQSFLEGDGELAFGNYIGLCMSRLKSDTQAGKTACTHNFNNAGGTTCSICGITNTTSTSPTTGNSAGYTYNPDAAIAYAKAHWNDGVGLCARFVSDCLKAGGFTAVYNTNAKNLGRELQAYGTKITCSGWSSSSCLKASMFTGTLSKGDIIVWENKSGSSASGHVMLYSGKTNSSGQILVYAHNAALNEQVIKPSSEASTVYAIHLESNHTHNYSTYVYYEAAHPHYKCYQCSCGAVTANYSEPTNISGCSSCTSSGAKLPNPVSMSVREETFMLKNAAYPSMYLNVYAGKDANATKVVAWEKDLATKDQQFKMIHLGQGAYYFQAAGLTNRVLDIYWGSNNVVDYGDTLQVWTKGEYDETTIFNVIPVGDNKYAIELKNLDNAVLTMSSGQNGSTVTLQNYTEGDAQHWYFCNLSGNTVNPCAHTYDNACDTTCNTCGATRTVSGHVYDNSADADCNVCGATREIKAEILYHLVNGKMTVKGVTGTISGDVTIPSTIDGYPVEAIGARAFANCTALKSIVLPETVTTIHAQAFYGCTGLTGIKSPGSVTSVGAQAFYDCTSLKTCLLGNNVTEFGDYAYYNCDSLTEISLSGNVTSIGDFLFADCNKLRTFTMDDGVASIGAYSFYNCTRLESVSLPDSVTVIGTSAFSGCGTLSNVYYRGSVTNKEAIGMESGNENLVAATWYYNACMGSADHVYDDDCDDICNKCGDARVALHVYSSTCDDCCDECGFVREEVEHTYGDVCDRDCNVCGAPRAVGDHVYDNEQDATCNNCGAVRDVNVPYIVIDDLSANAGDTIEVPIRLLNNPGIASMVIDVAYDSAALELIGNKNGNYDGNYSYSQYFTKNPYRINWYNALTEEDIGGDDVFAVLVFKVKDDAAVGVYDFTVTYDQANVCDVNFNDVYFDTQCGSITVKDDSWKGDINGDGAVNNRDAMFLTRYINEWDVEVVEKALDVNADGSVNNRDVMVLTRYLNEWDVTLY